MRRVKKLLCIILVLAMLFPSAIIRGEEKDIIEKSMEGDVEWNIEQIRAQDSYKESKNYKKIKVALLDSGVDVDEDIDCAERINFLDNADEDLNFMMDDITGHGTSIAGLICAKENEERACGIAANVELYSAKVFDYQNKAPVERIVKAIQWAMDQRVNIIHMSFGTSEYSPELRQIVKKAYEQGILIVAAAGNDGTAGEDESTVLYPGAFEEVLSVGATDIDNKKASWSASGEELDIVAPGDKILSAGAFGGIIVQEGTSLAAAQVTGVAAVLWGKYPNENNDFIMQLIKNSANDAVNDNGNENEQGKCGSGMLDYEQAKSNYSKMRKIYGQLKAKGVSDAKAAETAATSIEGMNEPLRRYDSVNYVNGTWKADNHKKFFQKANGDKKFIKSDKDICLVKIAATIPDEITTMKTLSQHPCFHGGGNYIANTEYLYYLSQKYGSAGKLEEYNVVFNENPEVYNGVESKQDIRADLQKATGQLFSKCKEKAGLKKELTVPQKKLVFLGVALHNATDVFAHRAYKYFKYNSKIQDGVDNNGEIKFKSYSKYVWAAIVHPGKGIKNSEAKKKAVPVVWEKLNKRNKNKKDTQKDRDQLTRIVNYGSLQSNLAIADKVSGDGIRMPKKLSEYAQSIATYLVGNWNKKKRVLAYTGFGKIAKKAEKKIRFENDISKSKVEESKNVLMVGLAYFNKYWLKVTNEDKRWKISQEPAKVVLPDVARTIAFKGGGSKKSPKSIQFVGNETTNYIAYEWKKGGKVEWLKVEKKQEGAKENSNNAKRDIICSLPKKKLTTGSVIVAAYNGLSYKTETLYWKKKITYTKEGLNKKNKVTGKDFSVYQYWGEKNKKVSKKLNFKKNGKKCIGYSKKKNGDIIKEVSYGKGKAVKLYPIFK